MFKEREPVKSKGSKDWQKEECLWNLYIETVKQLKHNGAKNQPTTINEGLLHIWVKLPDNPTTTKPIERNQTCETN